MTQLNPDIANLSGYRKDLAKLQNYMNNHIDWLDCAYGKSIRQYSGEDNERVFPVIYLNRIDYKELSPNEKENFSFFEITSQEVTQYYEDGDPYEGEVNVTIIVWVNSLRVYPEFDYRFDEVQEVIKKEILDAVTNSGVKASDFEKFDSFQNVYTDYNFNTLTQRLFKAPYFAFKVNFTMTYDAHVTLDTEPIPPDFQGFPYSLPLSLSDKRNVDGFPYNLPFSLGERPVNMLGFPYGLPLSLSDKPTTGIPYSLPFSLEQ